RFSMFPLESESGIETRLPSIDELAAMPVVDEAPTFVEDYYDQSDVGGLVSLLSDPSYEQHQRRALALSGLISDGSDKHVYALSNHAGLPGADKSAAMVALGAIASRNGSTLALEQIVSEYDRGSQRAAVLGLIVSGNSKAREMLT